MAFFLSITLTYLLFYVGCIDSTVTVSDGRFTDTEPLTICLTGENQRPYWVNEPYIVDNVASNVANNSVLLTVLARDDDLQGTISYSVSQNSLLIIFCF